MEMGIINIKFLIIDFYLFKQFCKRINRTMMDNLLILY